MAGPATLAPQALEAWAGEQSRMWTFITQLLVTLVLLGFFLVSCQNVAHIVRGSLGFVLKHVHQELDKELGESEGLSDDEETISTRVVRRRVLLKVTQGGVGGTRGARPDAPQEERSRSLAGGRWGCAGRSWVALPRPPQPPSLTMAEKAPLCDSGSWPSSCFCPQPAQGGSKTPHLGAQASVAGAFFPLMCHLNRCQAFPPSSGSSSVNLFCPLQGMMAGICHSALP